MVDILAAARYLIFLSYGRKRYSLTPLKLQKLLYLSQGWSYVWDNSPVFKDDFCAWKYGPANETVYEAFKKYGRSEIPEIEGCDSIVDKNIKTTLEVIWAEYGKIKSYDLVKLTQSQFPWENAHSKKIRITNNNIQAYFQSTFFMR